MSKWIRRDDRVVVIAGNEKGSIGTVQARQEGRVIVKGVNLRKKTMKKTQKTQTSQILEVEMPLHISNIRICEEDGTPLKLKVIHQKDNSKDLCYQKNGKEIVLRTLKKRVK